MAYFFAVGVSLSRFPSVLSLRLHQLRPGRPRRRPRAKPVDHAPTAARSEAVLPRSVLQGEEATGQTHAAAIYDTALVFLLINKKFPISTLFPSTGQLVQGRAVLPLPRDAPRQHQLGRGAEGPAGAHTGLR